MALKEFPGFLLFNLRFKSLICSGFDSSDWQIVLEEKLYTLHEISHRKTILENVTAATSYLMLTTLKAQVAKARILIYF